MLSVVFFFFFFKQKTAYEMCGRDWSSDVCSSDLKLKIEDPKILFEPTFRECRDIILRCFSEIIASGEGLSRVECEVFPEMKGQRLLLRSVKIEESLVAEFTDKAMNIFKKNTVGPQK